MKKISIILVCFISVTHTWAQKPMIIKRLVTLPPDSPILVIDLEEDFINDGVYVGSIGSAHLSNTSPCDYFEIVRGLSDLARRYGSNIVKLTNVTEPDQLNRCYKISADIYKVSSIRKHEKTIEWNVNRRLTWDDFKGDPLPHAADQAAAISHCGLSFQSNFVKPNMAVKITVTCKFDCKKSWVKQEHKESRSLLEHEQYHFNITEIYARKLRKAFNEATITSKNLQMISQKIYKKIYNALTEEQEKYDRETNHGVDQIKQAEWKEKVDTELNQLHAYIK